MNTKATKRVIGIGGIFFKADNPKELYAWYERHLGIKSEHGVAIFPWRRADDPSQETCTAWSIFPRDTTKSFGPRQAPFIINYQVEDLDALLEALRTEGVTIDPKREEDEFGRFASIVDPEGNRIELWEPRKESGDAKNG
ncbi:MAG TPA: VOC family protein [Methylomirabilota bacterium]|nr:VOC family protein [Methylomirabilota bacterium]